MSQLQKLLDSKFPMTEGMSSEGVRLFTIWREIFEEGYNAAISGTGWLSLSAPIGEAEDVRIVPKCTKCPVLGLALTRHHQLRCEANGMRYRYISEEQAKTFPSWCPMKKTPLVINNITYSTI